MLKQEFIISYIAIYHHVIINCVIGNHTNDLMNTGSSYSERKGLFVYQHYCGFHLHR